MASEDPQRSTGGSARSTGRSSRSQNPQQQLSTIEKSVTHLLVATKQLLETLTMWSRGSASESEVSDVYVRLGYEFNIACRAFNAIGVETSDLGPVPDLLRAILEDTLSQEASQASLDKYLPRIRDIIINLLHGLKKKQQRLRQRHASGEGSSRPPRQASTASSTSVESSLTQQLAEVPNRQTSGRSFAERAAGGDLGGSDLPPRTTSAPTGRASPRRQQNLSPSRSMHDTPSRETFPSDPRMSASSNVLQNTPVIAPYPESETMPGNQGYEAEQPSPSPEPPKPPPKQNDALAALSRGGDLERRASRRFSAYQIQKHLGSTMNGIAAIPPAQHSPIPNRGRDVRESMSAVRSRGSTLSSRTKPRHERMVSYEPSPNRQNEARSVSEEPSSQAEQLPPPPKPAAQEQMDSPTAKTPEDKLGEYPFPRDEQEKPSATLNGPIEDHFASSEGQVESKADKEDLPMRKVSRQAIYHTPPSSQYGPESSPQQGKELTLFLQYKSKIKKFVLPDGGDLSIPRLQLAFIEKFAWNTQNNGVDLPEIYIQDPVSGVRHELEDLNDIKERSVLVLNIEALDEVKRHIDDGIGGLRRIVEGIKSGLEDQQSALQLVSNQQQETARELAGMSVPSSGTSGPRSVSGTAKNVQIKDQDGQLHEVQSLRRDIAVVRQTYNSFVSDINASMATIKTKAAGVKKVAADTQVPEMDTNSGRSYVNKGKKQLSEDSEKIVNRVDDLQDLVEDLRKDVVTRGVRPLPRQLEGVSKDISLATSELKKMQEYLKREKPVWTKIWEKELQVVCDDRDLLTMQEELATDLEDDLEKAAATFALVEQATKQQNIKNDEQQGNRIPSRTMLNPLAMDRGADPHKAKDSVLGEVRALEPNHENRLEAIERAEKARRRELETRKVGEFQRELGNFVDEGKLKKTGGHEEVERMRLVREERARKEFSERQRERLRMKAEKDAAAAQAPAEPEAPAEQNGDQPAPDGSLPETATPAEATPDATPDAENQDAESGKSLEVPATEDGRASSPEPEFVEAKEDVNTPSTESGP
ncbi:AIP3-domain-containing protein [Hortaea werneckii]|nr:AIP3-domain-containing protein [Hortaea werneckii]